MSEFPSADRPPSQPPSNPYAAQEQTQRILSPHEQAAWDVCETLNEFPGYRGTFTFGTPGGNDLDLRVCFDRLEGLPEEEIRRRFYELSGRIGTEVDLLFMETEELQIGRVRDLTELGDVEMRLRDGFDPHQGQAAVGDTSLFSLYIFATMTELHQNATATDGPLPSPKDILDSLQLTREGAVGWTHFYTGCFLHEYLKSRPQGGQMDATQQRAYQERLAKFFSRVTLGSALARMLPGLNDEQRKGLQQELITAIQGAAGSSTDEKMSEALMHRPDSLLSPEVNDLLQIAGRIRSDPDAEVPSDFIERAESMLFYNAFQQGIDRRPDEGENADPLTSYALGELARSMGQPITFEQGDEILTQDDRDGALIYIPQKKSNGQQNSGVTISIRDNEGNLTFQHRSAGRMLGEAALFEQPRSATVHADDAMEVYVIDARRVQALLANPAVQRELATETLHSSDALRADVLLRYLSREAGIFIRHTLPYTTMPDQPAPVAPRANPLEGYDLGSTFHDMLKLYANTLIHADVAAGEQEPVSVVSTSTPAALFNNNDRLDHFFVVSKGKVHITLQTGEEIELKPGAMFGESALLGLQTTGSATLDSDSEVLAVRASWFKRFTQSRKAPEDLVMPDNLQGILPIHLLYHVAAVGYKTVQQRLQSHNRPAAN